MTLRALSWYRVKKTSQYCQVAGIMSKNDPQIRVGTATQNMSHFAVALVWLTPSNEIREEWTKRAIMVDLKKAFALLSEPLADDLPALRRLKAIANDIPFQTMSVDGVKTEPTGGP